MTEWEVEQRASDIRLYPENPSRQRDELLELYRDALRSFVEDGYDRQVAEALLAVSIEP